MRLESFARSSGACCRSLQPTFSGAVAVEVARSCWAGGAMPLFGGATCRPARILCCTAALVGLPLLLVVVLTENDPSSSNPFIDFARAFRSVPPRERDGSIWNVRRIVEWRPCRWWQTGTHLTALPATSNGYIRVDCYGGLNQMRRDFCDGIGIARLLNATLVLPKFEAAAYWNESSGFADVFDVDYFIEQTKDFIHVVRYLPEDILSGEPFRVDCSKRKGQFDYVEHVLPFLLKHRYISITPAMSQRRDRYPLYAKATLCQACYKALQLNQDLGSKGSKLLSLMPKPFLSLHLRFEPDMVAYSQCHYIGLSSASMDAIEGARGNRRPFTGDVARYWRERGKCPLMPNETAFILQSLAIPAHTPIYLAAGDGILELEGLTSIYRNVYTKSSLLSREDFAQMGGNTKAALDYYISINSDAYIATFFGNMDKMVAAMRAARGLHRTLFLSRRAFAVGVSKGLAGAELATAMWEAHREDYIMGRGSALPDCFCETKL